MPVLRTKRINSVNDPDIVIVTRQIHKYIELSADKAVANSIDPKRFPVEKGTLEYILSRRLKFTPKANPKKDETEEEMNKIKAKKLASVQNKWKLRYTEAGRIKLNNKRDRIYFGQLTKLVRMDSIEPIYSQLPSGYFFNKSPQLVGRMEKLARPLAPNDPVSVDAYNWAKELLGTEILPADPAPQKTKLECLIKEVTCLDETNGFCWSEAGSDEIKLGGLAIGPTGIVNQINAFNVKSFEHDGDKKVYEAPNYKKFGEFSLTDEGDWPRPFFSTFVLAEIDMGGFGEFLSELVDQVRLDIASQLAAMVGPEAAAIIIAAGVPGIVAAAVAIALMIIVFIIVIAIFSFLKTVWEDDIFEPQTEYIILNNKNEANNLDYVGEDLWGRVGFTGHGGCYQLQYSWRSK